MFTDAPVNTSGYTMFIVDVLSEFSGNKTFILSPEVQGERATYN